VSDKGWTVPASGLARPYRRGRKAYAAAQSRTTTDLHEWRKQVKYLRYQFQILEPLSPKKIGKLEEKAHALTDDLGEDHDLAVLGQRIEDAEGRLLDGKTRDAVLTLIQHRRRRLQEKAFGRGRRLYRERPKHLRRRFARYWARRDEARSAAR
jgi:CHAD domain-containing protein